MSAPATPSHTIRRRHRSTTFASPRSDTPPSGLGTDSRPVLDSGISTSSGILVSANHQTVRLHVSDTIRKWTPVHREAGSPVPSQAHECAKNREACEEFRLADLGPTPQVPHSLRPKPPVRLALES